MHYYQMNIGDYASHTSHLSPMEDLAYRRLLDFYYLHEEPIVNDIDFITRKIRMNGCSTDVQQVLNEFFKLVDNTWINERADSEILAFKHKKTQAKEAGKASGEARRERSLNVRSTDDEPNKKHKPLTINHKPINKTHTVENCNTSEINELGRVCLAIKSNGIVDINPSNPIFIALLNAGAGVDEFTNATVQAVNAGKPKFSYLLGIVKNQREAAKNLNLHVGAMPASNYQESISNVAKSVFKPEYIAEQTRNEMEVVNEHTRQIA